MTSLEAKNGLGLGGGAALDRRLRQQPDGGVDGWIGANTLGGVVLEAVRLVDERELKRVAPADAGVAYRPITLLALVTYCYTAEIYGAAEIEDLMRRDAAFRTLCGNEFPDGRAIRRFRRHNREAIHRSLVETFRRLMNGCGSQSATHREASAGERGTGTGPNGRPLCRDYACRAELARRGVRFPEATSTFTEQALGEEAQRRLETATWIDHMALDD